MQLMGKRGESNADHSLFLALLRQSSRREEGEKQGNHLSFSYSHLALLRERVNRLSWLHVQLHGWQLATKLLTSHPAFRTASSRLEGSMRRRNGCLLSNTRRRQPFFSILAPVTSLLASLSYTTQQPLRRTASQQREANAATVRGVLVLPVDQVTGRESRRKGG